MSILELFEEIREQCDTHCWSKAVQLSRRDAVTGDLETEDEVSLRVLDRSLGLGVHVQLFLQDLDWAKDCNCPSDPCHHVAAAMIVLKQTKDAGRKLPRSQTASGTIDYHFQRTDQGLSLQRYIKIDQQKTLLTKRLTTNNTARNDLSFSPTKMDLAIDIALGNMVNGLLPQENATKLARFFKELEGKLFLDENPIYADTKELGVVVKLTDQGHGVYLQAGMDTRITETFKNGWALVEHTLHPIKPFKFHQRELQILKEGKYFAPSELAKLSSEYIPYLSKKVFIHNTSQNLPQIVRDRPRLEIELKKLGTRLQTTPYIVYGNPPIAKVIDGELRGFGSQLPIRDFDLERQLQDKCYRDHRIELNRTLYFEGAAAVDYVSSLKTWKGDITGDGVKAFSLHPPLESHLSISEDDFSIDFTSASKEGKKTAFPAQVLAAWERGDHMVPLLDGGWAQLPQDWLQKYGHQIKELLMAKEGQEELPKAVLPSLAQLAEATGAELSPSLRAWKNKMSDFDKIPGATLPKPLNAQLRSYQHQGVNWLAFLQSHGLGALLADDMGLGKTLQTITILKGRCLVVAPTSVIPNWEREIQRFRPNLSINIYHGSQRKLQPLANIVLTSYGLLRQDIETLETIHWAAIVLDEAQWIKNPDSQVTQSAYRLRGDFRLALSGTPIENSLEDLWSQFQFLNPGLLGHRHYFRDEYMKPILEGQAASLALLRNKIKPFLLRRMKNEVAKELPPKTEQILYTELSEKEQSLYDSIRLATKSEVIEKLNAGGSIFEALEALLRMRQACCHPSLLPQQSAETSSKVQMLLEKLTTALAEGHKALIFSQWTSFLDIIGSALSSAKINFLRLDGSSRNRGSIVSEFQSNDGPPVLIMSLKAGGVGLNLSRADHVFIMDPWWNPAVEDQAADRAHRIGQENPVMVHPIVAMGTVEEQILELQNQKRELAASAVGEGKAALKLDKQDILQLFEKI